MFAERLAQGLGPRGWEVSFLSLTTADRPPRVIAEPVSGRRPHSLGRLAPDVVLGLRRRVRAVSPDVVLANGSATLRYTLAATLAMSPRPLLAYASIGEPRYWAPSTLRRQIQGFLLRRVDLILAVSETTRRQLVEGFGVPSRRVAVARTGVPAEFFRVPPRSAAGPGRLLFVGNLSPEKNPAMVLDVLGRLRGRTELRFLGDGPLRGELEEQAARLGLSNRVEFAGSVEDLRPHLAWADVLVATSRTEGLPGAVLEAAAAGVPTVAFAVGGTWEAIEDGKTGRLVSSGDVVAMAEAIEDLLEDESLLARWGKAAQRMATERFRLDQAVERYDALLRELLGVGQGRGSRAIGG